ncbi:MAG: hypothetical protein R3279_06425 [Putridiphycobacter sp.]|nr:hypothetical protein [Putridiphycobacter sp.]
MATRILEATFDSSLRGIEWALNEEVQDSDDEYICDRFTINTRSFDAPLHLGNAAPVVKVHQTIITGSAQAIMFLVARIAGAGEDYLRSIKTIRANAQYNAYLVQDTADEKKRGSRIL